VGDVALVTATSVLMVDYTGDGFGAKQLRLLRIRDGSTVWTRDAAGAYSWTTLGADPQRPTGLATATPTGDIRVYRFADGAEVTRGRVPWQAGSLTGGTLTQMYGTGTLLYVFNSRSDSTTVSAYAPDTLQRRWEFSTGTGNFPAACGSVLCVPVRDGLSGRDWATGAGLRPRPRRHRAPDPGRRRGRRPRVPGRPDRPPADRPGRRRRGLGHRDGHGGRDRAHPVAGRPAVGEPGRPAQRRGVPARHDRAGDQQPVV
jgi:hypothetical protein